MSLSKDLVQLIKEDHDRARSLYEQYKLPGTNAAQKRLLAWSLIREVSLHAAKEEEVRYRGRLAPSTAPVTAAVAP